MNLTTPSSDPKQLQAQIQLFKQFKIDHEKQIKELTRGQDVAQIEARARKMLQDAKAEASDIIAKAKRGVDQVEKSKGDYKALKSKLEQSSQDIIKAKQAALKSKQEADQIKSEAENIKAELTKKLNECSAMRDRLRGRVKELQDMLARFDVSIN